MKEFLMTTKFKNIAYSLVMYTYYGYLPARGANLPNNDEALLKDFGFFAKVVNLGIWSSSNNLSSLNIKSVGLIARGIVNVNASQNSNILQDMIEMPFSIRVEKEDGQWKLNLMSTFDYTKNQIDRVGKPGEGPKLYRKKIRDDLKKLKPDVKFAPEFIY